MRRTRAGYGPMATTSSGIAGSLVEDAGGARRYRPPSPRDSPPPSERIPAAPGVVCLVVVFGVYLWLSWRAWGLGAGTGPLSWYTSLLWSLPALTSALGLAGMLSAVRRMRREAQAPDLPERVDDLLVVLVPTVARPDTVVALERVVLSFVEHLPARFAHVRVDVVVDEGSPAADRVAALAQDGPVRVLTVPSAYRTPHGTRFKARANHYAHELRIAEGEARADVWVLHMDDDTAVGPDTAMALARFVCAQPVAGDGARHLTQGILSFPRELGARRLLWLADAVRPGCDISLFAGTTGRGSPRIGLHGELLLIRASVEADIGWDFGPAAIVEDAQFALEFCARYPGRSDWFPARSYGAPPATVADFLRQRERWSWGLLALVTDRTVPVRRRALLFSLVSVWTVSLLQHPLLVLVLALLVRDTATRPLSAAIIPLWSLNVAFAVWLYWEGLKINASASAHPRRYWWEPVALVLLLPLFALWEAIGVARGLGRFLRAGDRSFVVISKSS